MLTFRIPGVLWGSSFVSRASTYKFEGRLINIIYKGGCQKSSLINCQPYSSLHSFFFESTYHSVVPLNDSNLIVKDRG